MAFGKLSVDELISSNNISVTGNVSFTGNVTVGAGTASNAAISTSGDPNTGIYFPAADNIGFATGGTIRGRWTTDGLCFGSDTAAANALDDYEEGTWTVTLFDAITGGNASSTTTTGYYTKVGNLVTCSFSALGNISTSGMTGGNSLYVSLPFTPAQAASGVLALEFFTYTASRTESFGRVNASATRAVLAQAGSGQSVSVLTVASITSGTSDIDRFTMSFFV